MKKIFTMVTLLLFGLATFIQVSAGTLQDTTRKTKSGQPDSGYNAKKPLKKNSKTNMRFSKNGSKKVEAEKKKAVKP